MPKRHRRNDTDYIRFRPYRAIVASTPRSFLDGIALRSRMLYAVLALVVVGLGLLWRSNWLPLAPGVAKFGGDALWSLMVFFGFRFLWPSLRIWNAALTALVFSFAIEFSQLYHAPWIDHLRSYRVGGLILGSTFNWPDLGAYAAGVLLGAIGETLFARSRD